MAAISNHLHVRTLPSHSIHDTSVLEEANAVRTIGQGEEHEATFVPCFPGPG
jgi:hypothetical protein